MSFLTELALIGVVDAGVPNRERIVLRPMQDVLLNDFGITLGVPSPEGGAYPVYENVFWFPEILVSPPAWVLLFTGLGTPKEATIEGVNVLSLFWQRKTTVFGLGLVAPILFQLAGATVGRIPVVPDQSKLLQK